PTAYLRSRCPACFGSNRRHSGTDANAPDSIVQMDACFSQKHNTQTRDPPFHHPDGVMLDESTVAEADVRVRELRKLRKGRRKRPGRARSQSPPLSLRAAGIRVPEEALKNCKESFKAAQESIAKASTGSHDVTASMALLC
ncbi:hypothetical protein EV121DRAFT_179637, partial [Schizophyllum commune]